MALSEPMFQQFKSELRRASQVLASAELIYHTEWIFELPTASLRIADVFLHERFEIPVGLAGYGEDDLATLVNEGFLIKVTESEDDPVTHEKTITYRVNDKD